MTKFNMQGRHWQTHGHTHSGRMYLLAEEALFLAECVSVQYVVLDIILFITSTRIVDHMCVYV